MKDTQIEAMLQAMLFARGESVPVKRLSEVLEISETKTYSLLEAMKKKYDSDSSFGIRLVQLEDSYQLSTKREYYECVRNLTERKRKASLTNAGLEVLSIVAYNQPITRSSIEFIRGVNSDGPLNNLISAGLIEEVGRLDAPGRPILFGTGEEFLRCFNLSSISELPDVELEYNFEDLNKELVEAQQVEFEEAKDDEIDFEIQTDDIKETAVESENKEPEDEKADGGEE
ncbi:MAG: SMC-Scp complex subunit ScpB [Ruminococcaceae bacterium]|nr:SMC-Scp complex subunit ScpB [Oscillospiraceae bacterium]